MLVERTCLDGDAFALSARGTGIVESLRCDAVFASVGYRGVAIAGLPFDDRKSTLRHEDGRICDDHGVPIHGLYCTGWIKRGPSGVIGTNRNDSIATVATLLADERADRLPSPVVDTDLTEFLEAKGVHVVNYARWKAIDECEKAEGARRGKSREKIIDSDSFLRVLAGPFS
jgi:ferredoxin--NADP+ reductase